MEVKLLRHTPEPEKTVAMSARLCYSPVGAAQLEETMSDEQAAKLVRKLVEMGHFSTLEHVTFTFAIEGVSRVLTHQLVRHRIASYSQQSQRYVKEHDFETIMPPTISSRPEAKAKFEQLMADIQARYNEFTDEFGIPAEDARYVLPNAAETKIVATFNVRSLMNFFSLRCCNRAQWEIRQLAEKMLAECKKADEKCSGSADNQQTLNPRTLRTLDNLRIVFECLLILPGISPSRIVGTDNSIFPLGQFRQRVGIGRIGLNNGQVRMNRRNFFGMQHNSHYPMTATQSFI